MYKILIEDLTFKAIIGILEEERVKEQLLIVCCQIEYEDKKNYIDYAEVANIIKNTIQTKRFFLIEDAMDEIETRLKKKFNNMKSLKLKIKKPEILNNALVGVEIFRKY